MAFFLTPKSNHITEQLQQISAGTSNSGVLNSAIAYINSNISKFSPAINYTQLNSTIQTYMTFVRFTLTIDTFYDVGVLEPRLI